MKKDKNDIIRLKLENERERLAIRRMELEKMKPADNIANQ